MQTALGEACPTVHPCLRIVRCRSIRSIGPRRLWEERIGPASTMAAVTNIMRVQQILQSSWIPRCARTG